MLQVVQRVVYVRAVPRSNPDVAPSLYPLTSQARTPTTVSAPHTVATHSRATSLGS